MTERRLDDRVAVVTRASRNIGSAIAEEFCPAGASLVVGPPTAANLDDAAERLSTAGDRPVVPIAGDLCDPRFVEEFAQRSINAFGWVDILINNALIDGGTDGLPVLEAPRKSWDRKLEYASGSSRA